MFRILLYIVIIYIAYKIVKIVLQQRSRPSRREKESVIPPFSNIQDADFEDITPKNKPEENKPPQEP